MNNERSKNKISWMFKTLFFLVLGGTVLITFISVVVYWYFSKDLPKIISLPDYRPALTTQIVLLDGEKETVIGELFNEVRRYLVPYEKIPEKVTRAFIAAEDDQFFVHQGINLASMLRAAVANFKAGRMAQGGSTITQQVVKSLLLTSEKSFDRKIKEIILAARLESNLKKEDILYLYLNQIYLGHGAYGVQAASLVYFNKDVSQLDLAETALLAGLPQAPGKYSPIINSKRAKERQNYVLRRMFENKFISQAEMLEASAKPLKIYLNTNVNLKYAPYWIEHLRRYVIEKYGEKTTYEGGLKIFIQNRIENLISAKNALQDGLRELDKRVGYRGPRRHYKNLSEIENALAEMRVKFAEKKLNFKMLMPDGRFDFIEAMKSQGYKSDLDLLEKDEIYEAIVTSIDDTKKTVGVMIGATKGELPITGLNWIKKPVAVKQPSQILSKGDLILVRIQNKAEHRVIVSLEQTPQVQGAIFSLEAKTGFVLAMVGGYDFEESEFNRVVQAFRQPGSAFKPIIYSAALEKGFTPASIIVDSPIVYDNAESGKWKPDNFVFNLFRSQHLLNLQNVLV
ncbi:MAG: transglycosylase domain-containing protein [Deltaproteobacteria bacterium]|nr:transglycosylase domain-containing protein [Deltaproteobacteria bacterium]